MGALSHIFGFLCKANALLCNVQRSTKPGGWSVDRQGTDGLEGVRVPQTRKHVSMGEKPLTQMGGGDSTTELTEDGKQQLGKLTQPGFRSRLPGEESGDPGKAGRCQSNHTDRWVTPDS